MRAALGVVLVLNAACVAGLAGAQTPASTSTPTPPPISLKNDVTNQGVFSFDYSVPSSPALALAGLSTDKSTVNSASLKPFVFSLPAVISGAGGQSAALDFAPAAIFQRPSAQSFNSYVESGNWLFRLAFRSRLNTALYNGVDGHGDPSKNKASRLAFGASISLLDSSDPLMARNKASRKAGTSAFLNCLNDHESQISQAGFDAIATPQVANLSLLVLLQAEVQYAWSGDHPEAFATPENAERIKKTLEEPVSFAGLDKYQLTAKLREYSDKIVQKLNDASARSNAALAATPAIKNIKEMAGGCTVLANNAALYAPALNLGGGTLLRGDAGHIRKFKKAGSVFWASGRYPLMQLDGKDSLVAGYLMLAAYARLSRGEYVATGDKTIPQIEASVQDYWGGLEYYSQRFKLAAQFGWTDTNARRKTEDNFSKSGTRYLVSGALPLGDVSNGTWLGITYGNARGTVESLKGHVFLLTLDFAPPKPADILGLAKH